MGQDLRNKANEGGDELSEVKEKEILLQKAPPLDLDKEIEGQEGLHCKSG